MLQMHTTEHECDTKDTLS